jgi:hypothetical protein
MADHGFTEEELNALSEEERQAVTAEYEDPTQIEGEDQGGEEPASTETPEGSAPTNDAPGDGQIPADLAQPEAQGVTAEASAQQQPFMPVYKADSTDDVDTKIAELNEQLSNGDIDLEEFHKLRDPLIIAKATAQAMSEFNKQSQQQLWQYEQNLFFKQFPEYRDNAALSGALHHVFRSIDTEENAGKTGLEILNEAKRVVDEQLGRAGGTPATQPQGQPLQAQQRTPALDKTPPPKTLAHIPAAAANGTGRDEFTHLDNLAGVDLERALSKLTPEQEDRYLRGVGI